MDLQKLVATTFTYMGGMLTLENGSTAVGQLLFSGSYTPAGFALKSDGHGGTDVLFVPPQAFGAGDLAASGHLGHLDGPEYGDAVGWHGEWHGPVPWLMSMLLHAS